jgi:hypothetical protein
LSQIRIQTKVAALCGMSFVIYKTHVVRASYDAVFTGDAIIGISSRYTRLFVFMAGVRRADVYARSLYALLAANPHEAPIKARILVGFILDIKPYLTLRD